MFVYPVRHCSGAGVAWLWVGPCCDALLTLLLLGMLPSARLSSSVLPQQERSGIGHVWQQELMSRLDRQLVWLVSLPLSKAGEDGEPPSGEYQALGKLPEF